jgi:hypothetical protein
MKISDKLLKKYATVSPMLPPPSGEDVEVEIPIPQNRVPVIEELSEEDMRDWDNFIQEKKLKKDLEVTKEIGGLGGEEKLEKELGTVPAIPKRKHADLSPNGLLKMCSQYHDLCRKLQSQDT